MSSFGLLGNDRRGCVAFTTVLNVLEAALEGST